MPLVSVGGTAYTTWKHSSKDLDVADDPVRNHLSEVLDMAGDTICNHVMEVLDVASDIVLGVVGDIREHLRGS